ncbi:sister chromatid cohesion protein DCC1-like [Chenopodium quinoa]|uniref:Sister chromatid cohesion protein DCC1 n=1 Tax=Chenopodium quinoa TaxID=63459 RepID=A0A803MDA5_CHEQI|nr:sister chromatid cohesion protein DCC1-like [Chenopodium quinoa]
MDKSGDAEAILDLQPKSSISVAYHSDFGPHEDLLLLELDEKLLPDVLSERVSLRGEPDEDAVFCTQSKTYAIKFVGNSNSVFLIPPSNSSSFPKNAMDCDEQILDQPASAFVLKVASGNLELVEVAPRLDKLKLLLAQKPFTIEEMSEMETFLVSEEQNSVYRWNDLIGQIQASDIELRSGLEALNALEINGYWRIIDENCMDSVLNMLLHNAVLNDWSLDALPETEVVSIMESDGFPPKLSNHCLKVYGNTVDNEDGVSLWKLNEKQVCVHFAKRIMKNGKVKKDKFLEEWKNKIPNGMQASFEMLECEVLTERIGVEIWIHPFSVSSLPSTPAERFSILFKERPKWEWKDLEPYIRDLKVPGLSSEGLLLKYTRRSQPRPDVEPIFSAR